MFRRIKRGVAMFLKSKTLMFNGLIGIAGAIELYSSSLSGLFKDPGSFGIFMVVIASIGSILRFMTIQSVQEKLGDQK